MTLGSVVVEMILRVELRFATMQHGAQCVDNMWGPINADVTCRTVGIFLNWCVQGDYRNLL